MQDFKCELTLITESNYSNSKNLRSGRYSQSSYTFAGFGSSKWVVLVYLKVDYNKYYSEGFSESELLDACTEFLSRPPPRKKYQKRKPRSKYGTLKPVPSKWKDGYAVREKVGTRDVLIAELIIDERRNKNFWNEGLVTQDVSSLKAQVKQHKGK